MRCEKQVVGITLVRLLRYADIVVRILLWLLLLLWLLIRVEEILRRAVWYRVIMLHWHSLNSYWTLALHRSLASQRHLLLLG